MPASAVVKSPTKILPAPVCGVTQLKSAVSIASAVGGMGGTVSTTVKPLLSPQKVIIRQVRNLYSEMSVKEVYFNSIQSLCKELINTLYHDILKDALKQRSSLK
jgi:hypothetical protein